jgi:hypothetical protein
MLNTQVHAVKQYETARHEVKVGRNGVILAHEVRPDAGGSAQ